MQRDSSLAAVQKIKLHSGLRVVTPTVVTVGVAITLLLAVGVASVRLLDTQSQVVATFEQAARTAAALAVAESALHRVDAATVRELLLSRAEEGIGAQQASRELLAALDVVQRGAMTEPARAATLRDEAEQLAVAAERVHDLLRRGEREAATRAYVDAVWPRVQHLTRTLAEERRRSLDAVNAAGQVQGGAAPARPALLAAMLVGLLAILVGGIIWGRQHQLRNQVVSGLGEALDRAAHYIGAFLRSSQQYAAGTAHQTAAIEEMATTTEDLSAGARYVAQSAERAEQLTGGSQRAVQDTIARMEEVQETVAAAVARITALGEHSRRVGVIAELISDIAGKTHLLSVNAAIEAVTAGPHGQRFAVVAGQVKDLAAETQEATAQVQSIVGEIRAATEALVAATQEAARVAEAGAVAAHGAGVAMDDVVEVVRTIATATRQQELASQQVVQTMRDVVAVARQSAAVSQQAAEEAQRLKATADELARLVADLERL